MYNWHDGNKDNLRTIEAPIVQKLNNNEIRPQFTGSYKKNVYISTVGVLWENSLLKRF